jgi:WD40 repeat protein
MAIRQGLSCVTTDIKGHVYIWSVDNGKEVAHYNIKYSDIFISIMAGYKCYMLRANTGTILVMDILTGDVREVCRVPGGYSLAVMRNGQFIAVGSSKGFVEIWDVRSSKQALRSTTFRKHNGLVNAVAFCGSNVISGGTDQLIYVWNPYTGAEITCAEGHSSTIIELFGVTDTAFLSAAGAPDNTLRMWDAKTGINTQEIAAVGAPIAHVHYTPEYRQAYTCTMDGVISRWDLIAATALPGTLPIPPIKLTSMWADPAGDCILGVGTDGILYVCDYEMGEVVRTMASEAKISSLAVNRNGQGYSD